MTIVGTSVLPEPTMPTSPPEEAGAQGPKTPNPTMDGTAEGGPPRGGMQEIFAARHAAKGEVVLDVLVLPGALAVSRHPLDDRLAPDLLVDENRLEQAGAQLQLLLGADGEDDG